VCAQFHQAKRKPLLRGAFRSNAILLDYGVAPGLAQVAEPAKHLVVSWPTPFGVNVMVVLPVTCALVRVAVSLHALPGMAGTEAILDMTAATAEFM